MKRSSIAGAGLRLGLLPLFALAVERPFEAGEPPDMGKKAHNVEEKVPSRVLYYLANTPVIRDDPYYEVTVQVKDTAAYVADFTSVHAERTLPDDWQIEGAIQAQVEKQRLFLQHPGEAEWQWAIVKQMAAAPGADAPNPSTSKH